MDPEVARMMADLGLERRDFVSAPEDGPRHRRKQDDGILAMAEEHRARGQQAREDDPHSAIISKWNTPEVFGRDDVADALENRYSGQGHRAALQQSMGEGRQSHDFAPRGHHNAPNGHTERDLGDERRLFLQERQTRNYTIAPRPNGPARQRASSPRSYGTVRFDSGRARRTGNAPRNTPTAKKPLPPDVKLQEVLAKFKGVQAPMQQSVPVVEPETDNSQTISDADIEPLVEPTQTFLTKLEPSTIIEKEWELVESPVTLEPPVEPKQNLVREPEPSASDNSPRSSSVNSLASTDLSTPTPSKKNYVFSATFYDIAGNLLDRHRYAIDAPVEASVTITSRLRRYNPLELADAMKSMAQLMYDRTHRVSGFKKSPDGLWEEVDSECDL